MEIMTTCLTRSFRLFAGDRKGATALEYGLIAAFIAGVIVVSVTQLGHEVKHLFIHLANKISDAS